MINWFLYILGIPPKLPSPPEGHRLVVHGEYVPLIAKVKRFEGHYWYDDWWFGYDYDQWSMLPTAVPITENEKIPVPRKTRYTLKNRILKILGIPPKLPSPPEGYRLANHGEKISLEYDIKSYVDGIWVEDIWFGDYNQWLHWPTAILVKKKFGSLKMTS